MEKTKSQGKIATSSASKSNFNHHKDKNVNFERSVFIYDTVNKWIENADNKVSVSCGIFTGVFGIVTFLAERYITVPNNPVAIVCWRNIYISCFVISFVIMAAAVLFYAIAIIPNLKSNNEGDASEKEFPVYYGDISTLKYEDYHYLMIRGTDEAFLEELIHESWYNSRICMRKMKWYKAGVIASLVAIAFAFLSFGAHCLMYK